MSACKRCPVELTEETRYQDRAYCKDCWKDYAAECRADPSSKMFKAMFCGNVRRYGLDPEDIWSKFQTHNGLCDICGSPPRGNNSVRLYVDHCHKTGKFRGFICYHCNVALGHVGDCADILSRMINYLNDNGPTGG